MWDDKGYGMLALERNNLRGSVQVAVAVFFHFTRLYLAASIPAYGNTGLNTDTMFHLEIRTYWMPPRVKRSEHEAIKILTTDETKAV